MDPIGSASQEAPLPLAELEALRVALGIPALRRWGTGTEHVAELIEAQMARDGCSAAEAAARLLAEGTA